MLIIIKDIVLFVLCSFYAYFWRKKEGIMGKKKRIEEFNNRSIMVQVLQRRGDEDCSYDTLIHVGMIVRYKGKEYKITASDDEENIVEAVNVENGNLKYLYVYELDWD